MKPVPVIRAARGGLSGRRVQAIVIGLVVGVSTAASTAALGMVVDSSAPFGHAFTVSHGADVTVTVTGASPTELAATTRLSGVTVSAGPFPETAASVTTQVSPGHGKKGTPVTLHQQLTLVGRSSPGGPVDDLTLTSGNWPAGLGQVVLSGAPGGIGLGVGSQFTVTGVTETQRKRAWFITGAGRGFGLLFTHTALARGDMVAGTVRQPGQLEDLQPRSEGRLVALPLDVRDRAAVFAAVETAADAFGRLDIVINNAGYG